MDSRKGNIAQDIEQAEQQLETEQQALLAEQTALDACCQALEMAENQLAGVVRKAEIRQKKVEERTQALAAVTAEVTDTGNRIRMLREMKRDYEGFSRAVKRIMQQADSGRMTGIHGPVSELITVPPKFITAIETALGAAASHIVVDTPQDGKRAIEYLKRTDGGRATFLPLDTIRPMSLKGQYCAGHRTGRAAARNRAASPACRANCAGCLLSGAGNGGKSAGRRGA